ncbi:hypothetical protein COBT_002881 [Conglomerata obtusa]
MLSLFIAWYNMISITQCSKSSRIKNIGSVTGNSKSDIETIYQQVKSNNKNIKVINRCDKATKKQDEDNDSIYFTKIKTSKFKIEKIIIAQKKLEENQLNAEKTETKNNDTKIHENDNERTIRLYNRKRKNEETLSICNLITGTSEVSEFDNKNNLNSKIAKASNISIEDNITREITDILAIFKPNLCFNSLKLGYPITNEHEELIIPQYFYTYNKIYKDIPQLQFADFNSEIFYLIDENFELNAYIDNTSRNRLQFFKVAKLFINRTSNIYNKIKHINNVQELFDYSKKLKFYKECNRYRYMENFFAIYHHNKTYENLSLNITVKTYRKTSVLQDKIVLNCKHAILEMLKVNNYEFNWFRYGRNIHNQILRANNQLKYHIKTNNKLKNFLYYKNQHKKVFFVLKYETSIDNINIIRKDTLSYVYNENKLQDIFEKYDVLNDLKISLAKALHGLFASINDVDFLNFSFIFKKIKDLPKIEISNNEILLELVNICF